MTAEPAGRDTASSRQRIDKWLWFARVVKTRSLAAKLVSAGHVRVNAQRVQDPAKSVKSGDVVTVALDRQIRVLRILAGGDRRGPFTEAQHLFEDLSERPAGSAEAGG